MKKVTIEHDGRLTVSGYGTVNLGNHSLNGIIATALELDVNDYKEYVAEVVVQIKIKPDMPTVRCDKC